MRVSIFDRALDRAGAKVAEITPDGEDDLWEREGSLKSVDARGTLH